MPIFIKFGPEIPFCISLDNIFGQINKIIFTSDLCMVGICMGGGGEGKNCFLGPRGVILNTISLILSGFQDENFTDTSGSFVVYSTVGSIFLK